MANDPAEIVSRSDIAQAIEVGKNYEGPKRVVFIVNTDRFFLSHRATWAVAMQASGAAVTVIAEDTGQAEEIRKLGLVFIDISVGRETSAGIIDMTSAALKIFTELVRIRPDTVFLVQQVAYTIGWPAALVLRRTNFIRVPGGVGRALDSTTSAGGRATQVVKWSGRASGRTNNVYTLFQTEDNRLTFRELGLLSDVDRSIVIGGTGVNVANYEQAATVRQFENPVILFASRLVREKGLFEFVEVAKMLRYRNWRFQIAGSPDSGVESAVSTEELDSWRQSGIVEVLGHRSDMANVFADATLFVFPTRHPEGTPRVLMEAGASGLPSVVSGHPGCEAVVEHNVGGVVLGPVPSADELAEAVATLASDPERAREMGVAARERVSLIYSIEAVLSALLSWEPVGAKPR